MATKEINLDLAGVGRSKQIFLNPLDGVTFDRSGSMGYTHVDCACQGENDAR
ncbi:MAG: hypothetical protein ACYCZF_00550 [Anaerolineae bacterium]